MSASQATIHPLQAALQRRGVREFVKFCIVGAGSTAINYAVLYLITQRTALPDVLGVTLVTQALAPAIAFLVSVANGFYWNNRWTFRQGGREGAHRRYFKFLATNTVGLALTLGIVPLVAHLVPRSLVARMVPYVHRDPAAVFGYLCATAVVVFWNFAASKYWTFKS